MPEPTRVAADATSTTAIEEASSVQIRPLITPPEFAACVELQRTTWGTDFADTVPASVLKVGQHVGGVCAGAFAEDGRLVGFVFGLPGVMDGRLMHWSHMLAVEPGLRDHGVGRRLKEYQRAMLRDSGVETMYWTFDPLVARNAHLNLNRLGARIREYVPDMYVETGSILHAFGTDRFVVSWPIASAAPTGVSCPVAAAWRAAPVLSRTSDGQLGAQVSDLSLDDAADGSSLRVEVPADISRLPLEEAVSWRMATRRTFVHLLRGGYTVEGFYADEGGRRFYVLERTGVS